MSSSILPEPIFMSPLCWMKMVSLVRLPWMMGGSQECRKLGTYTVLSVLPVPSQEDGRWQRAYLRADRIWVHQRFQA